MHLACAHCLREGRAAPVYGLERPIVRPGAQPAKPAVTVTGGEAVCNDHLPQHTNGTQP